MLLRVNERYNIFNNLRVGTANPSNFINIKVDKGLKLVHIFKKS